MLIVFSRLLSWIAVIALMVATYIALANLRFELALLFFVLIIIMLFIIHALNIALKENYKKSHQNA